MGIEKKTYSFRFDKKTIERLRVHAQLQNRTLSNFVVKSLMEKLEELELEQQIK